MHDKKLCGGPLRLLSLVCPDKANFSSMAARRRLTTPSALGAFEDMLRCGRSDHHRCRRALGHASRPEAVYAQMRALHPARKPRAPSRSKGRAEQGVAGDQATGATPPPPDGPDRDAAAPSHHRLSHNCVRNAP